MKKIIVLAFALMLGIGAASAQKSITLGDVPKPVKAQYENDLDKDALKATIWYKMDDQVMGEYNGVSRCYSKDGVFKYSIQYVEKSDLPGSAIKHFDKKMAKNYQYQRAAVATVPKEEDPLYFIIAKDPKYTYFLKYDKKGSYNDMEKFKNK